MKNLTFAVGSAYTALLAFIIVCIDQILKPYMPIGAENGFTYIAFVAWAVYFFSGTQKDGIRAWIGYVIGITFSVAICLIAAGLSGLSFFAVPTAVFIIVFVVLYLEKTSWTNYIPAMFVASGCFFGIINYVPPKSLPGTVSFFANAALVELLYGTIGLLFGWITVTGKGILSRALEK